MLQLLNKKTRETQLLQPVDGTRNTSSPILQDGDYDKDGDGNEDDEDLLVYQGNNVDADLLDL
jgi:hypothetical protein